MIDLHCHILPGLDDGPYRMEQSIEMARAAYMDGTHVIVATPHNRDVVQRSSVLKAKALATRLKRELEKRSVPLQALFGMENHLELDTPEQVERGAALPIEGTRFILIELPFEIYPFYTEDTLTKLFDMGLRPIVVHPERNEPIQRNPQLLADLVGRGALAQVTAGSLLGAFGETVREVSVELLRRGLVHVMASDGHDAHGDRAPILSAGVDAAARVVGMPAARRMVEDIPLAIIEDGDPVTDGLGMGGSGGR